MISIISTPLAPQTAPKTGDKSPVVGVNSVPAPEKNQQTAELSKEQQVEVTRLKKVDQQTRAHEAAHKNTGGQYAGNASYSYTVGPDGKRYAVGGEVPIDVSPIKDDPEATIAKLDVVIAAALAPSQPSAQDRKIAATAVTARNQARTELLEKNRTEEAESDQQNSPFDINDFGDTPVTSVNKAYESGNGLGQDNNPTGTNFSVSS
ncbi:MAG: hypothetical protein HOJ34_12255 [Kordiimonadaceae bacterium]|jgi:hypothetical protein|nr:hypothetical protein [Kordiimonadaceae bacterium]MBT6036026.1 hypothetical protein [Kordiimonadaceae bacterium]MBT6330543.1 hypothetical protein [Kordiimonadaceae bacterium]MBT7583199.1 hypothetical protein [Kordiimonadaceae bacterium]